MNFYGALFLKPAAIARISYRGCYSIKKTVSNAVFSGSNLAIFRAVAFTFFLRKTLSISD